jgi:ABC-2 type transport system ATP-binding protein
VNDSPAIVVDGITKHYGDTIAVDGVSFAVPRGVVFGYLGPNGAGKTTTIRILLGLLAPSGGRARLLGYDSWREREKAHRSIGYLPGDFTAYPELTSGDYLRYLGGLRGGVEWSHVTDLAERLDLRLDVRFGALSHGNRQKAGIVQAFMHRPALLILDEPTTGLDPLIQQEFLSIVRETRAEGRTIFMSSHVLSEVEDCADIVGMLSAGRLLLEKRIAALKELTVHHMTLIFDRLPPREILERAAGVHDVVLDGSRVRLTVEGSTKELLAVAAPFGIESLTSVEPGLEAIFLGLYRPEAS